MRASRDIVLAIRFEYAILNCDYGIWLSISSDPIQRPQFIAAFRLKHLQMQETLYKEDLERDDYRGLDQMLNE